MDSLAPPLWACCSALFAASNVDKRADAGLPVCQANTDPGIGGGGAGSWYAFGAGVTVTRDRYRARRRYPHRAGQSRIDAADGCPHGVGRAHDFQQAAAHVGHQAPGIRNAPLRVVAQLVNAQHRQRIRRGRLRRTPAVAVRPAGGHSNRLNVAPVSCAGGNSMPPTTISVPSCLRRINGGRVTRRPPAPRASVRCLNLPRQDDCPRPQCAVQRG